ncbi:GT2 family glycosyltransferase [Breznakia sp. PF5-3]|uniref:glycosyltransferase family 2 protein n=1 Tax=unclassified Breznakia TaxID=2623764 RepID=UPI002405F185|nr:MULTISPECIES: hypothetical protein [unclassified Breznakia]MDF9824984.1 GT2 family glycosyltransferase [Breznakia sp. PM6-1]MDF9835823.1 GT2 family glycosyltransferase [Breznakia sp. PF5-3]MDF9836925.1 GT2 family glycosyltransferase [Breznakia sp. PFB2-8]MDF9859871.1 GT2 family glycosyltransferase [Breznakia sp. PH5-24]
MVTFVILHYKSIKDTLSCIQSIQLLTEEHSIIVVDNHSNIPEDIMKIKATGVDFIELKENIGFAQGNNIGCEVAIRKYKPDFLCVINSDTIINQSDFISKIYKIHDATKFHVLGPKILPEDLDSSNPFPVYKDLEVVKNKIQYTKRVIRIYENYFLYCIFKIYSWSKHVFRKKDKLKNGDKRVYDVGLHGCALIFSKTYYEKYGKDIFYPGTFLYHEEEFLYYRCVKDSLIFIYDPEIEIIHNEGKSLHKTIKNDRQRSLFRNQEILKSLKKLEKIMEEDAEI